LGSDDASYSASLTLTGNPPRSSCTCPSFGSWDDHCKHVAALAFALQKRSRGSRPSLLGTEEVPAPTVETARAPEGPPRLEELRDWLGLPEQPVAFVYDLDLSLAPAIGVSRVERASARAPRFVQLASYLNGRTLEAADRRAFSVLMAGMRDPEGRYRLVSATAGAFFEALRTRSVAMGSGRVVFADHPAHLFAELSQTDEDRRVTLRLRLADGTLVALDKVRLLCDSPLFVLHDATIHRLDTGASAAQVHAWQDQPTHKLARDAGAALDFALGGLRQLGVILDAAAEASPLPPQFLLTLDGDAQQVTALLAVRYGEVELPLTSAGASTHVTT